MKTTKREAVEAAVSVADRLASGEIDPDDMVAAAVSECRRLFGRVDGPDDALWELHVDVARQVLAAGGIPVGELREWVAVWAAVEPERSWVETALAEYDDAGDDDTAPRD